MKECPLCKGLGVVGSQAREKKFRKEEMLALREDGLTYREIAEIYDKAPSHVYGIINGSLK